MKNSIASYFLFNLFTLAWSDSMLEMAKERNIEIERHDVITEDGYILGLYHLPSSAEKQSNGTRTMLMMHGFASCSQMYILYANRSAGPFFQNLGYDVWIGNARGNIFSRNHTTLDPDDAEFWRFSIDEIGYYDLPAMIDYVLNYTNQEKLIYIGHSQGGSISFMLLSEREEYNEKIAIAHEMAPAVIMKYHHPLCPDKENVVKLADWLNNTKHFELFSYKSFEYAVNFLAKACLDDVVSYICRGINDFLVGPSSPLSYTNNIFMEYVSHMPAGVGYRQLIHFLQLMNSGRFQKFDFGAKENIKIYGSSEPPEYNFTNIQAKIHILYGTHDDLIRQENMPILAKKIKHAAVGLSKFNLFNHMDFAYGRQVKNVQQFILKITNKFET